MDMYQQMKKAITSIPFYEDTAPPETPEQKRDNSFLTRFEQRPKPIPGDFVKYPEKASKPIATPVYNEKGVNVGVTRGTPLTPEESKELHDLMREAAVLDETKNWESPIDPNMLYTDIYTESPWAELQRLRYAKSMLGKSGPPTIAGPRGPVRP